MLQYRFTGLVLSSALAFSVGAAAQSTEAPAAWISPAPMPRTLRLDTPTPHRFATSSDHAWDTRSVAYDLWTRDFDNGTLALRLSGWAEDANASYGCATPGLSGCQDAAGATLSFAYTHTVSDRLTLSAQSGMFLSGNGLGIGASTTAVWWFSTHVGLAVTVGYTHPVSGQWVRPGNPQTERSALGAIADHEAVNHHETPYDAPGADDPTSQLLRGLFGGVGLVTRD